MTTIMMIIIMIINNTEIIIIIIITIIIISKVHKCFTGLVPLLEKLTSNGKDLGQDLKTVRQRLSRTVLGREFQTSGRALTKLC